jgi:hypothetical protein
VHVAASVPDGFIDREKSCALKVNASPIDELWLRDVGGLSTKLNA